MSSKLTGSMLSEMVIMSAALLEKNKEKLNALNVFPVPDGDTGTNMSLTMLAAAKEVNSVDEKDFVAVADALSIGALKGARGNSGVILSQIWRGFCDVIKKCDTGIDQKDLAESIANGVECAYKAIMKPKEGTILTVAKSLETSAEESADKGLSFDEMLNEMIEQAEDTLKKTPEMLPVLKEAGVVDAGGAGLLIIIKGFKMVLDGNTIDDTDLSLDYDDDVGIRSDVAINEDIEFGYCTEFFIKNLNDFVEERDIENFRNELSKLGDSLIVVGDLNLVKVHVHTNDPGIVLQHALTLGMLSKIKIDNMREQHRELSDNGDIVMPVTKDIAVVSVVAGDGLKKVFEDCAVDGFVEGGQTMNPSTDDILKAIKNAPSVNVIVLPNNKNIILAAEQAANLSSKNVSVIPSTTIPQGISAMLNYNSTDSVEENVENMNEAIKLVKSGQVTYAVRDTSLSGMKINKDDKIGICDGQILSSGTELNAVALDLIKNMIDEDSVVVSIYYGEDISEEYAEELKESVSELADWVDIELTYGGQAVYSYIISVE